jgi:dTMP kinase
MAAKLSEVQVAQLAEALKAVPDTGTHTDLEQALACLRKLSPLVFPFEELDRAAVAVSALAKPLSERPQWQAGRSRGLFFVFEGLDRSGKSTQSRKLRENLEKTGTKVEWMCFPNRETTIGTLIDLYLRKQVELPDRAVHLFFSANRWETATTIVEKLSQGVNIVCDRYAFSGVAYSAAKGLSFSWCQDCDRGLPVPDGVFFMHVAPEVGASRAGFGDERYENESMQATVRSQFQLPALRAGVQWHDVDGSRDIDVIHTEICKQVETIRQSEQENALPVQRLWSAVE